MLDPLVSDDLNLAELDPTMPGTVDESTGPLVTASAAPVDSGWLLPTLDELAEKLARSFVTGMGLDFDSFEQERRARVLAQSRIAVTGLVPANRRRE